MTIGAKWWIGDPLGCRLCVGVKVTVIVYADEREKEGKQDHQSGAKKKKIKDLHHRTPEIHDEESDPRSRALSATLGFGSTFSAWAGSFTTRILAGTALDRRAGRYR